MEGLVETAKSPSSGLLKFDSSCSRRTPLAVCHMSFGICKYPASERQEATTTAAEKLADLVPLPKLNAYLCRQHICKMQPASSDMPAPQPPPCHHELKPTASRHAGQAATRRDQARAFIEDIDSQVSHFTMSCDQHRHLDRPLLLRPGTTSVYDSAKSFS